MGMMHEAMGLVRGSVYLSCPVCDRVVLAHRVLGVGTCRGSSWLLFWPHRAPCKRSCAAGGILGAGHQGPRLCGCGMGQVNMRGNLALIDEAGLGQLAEKEKVK